MLGHQAPAAQRQIADPILADIGSYYRSLDPRRRAPPPPDLLACIDRGIVAFSQDTSPARRRDGLVLLASLRRNHKPNSPPNPSTENRRKLRLTASPGG